MENLEQEAHNGTCCKPCRNNIDRMWGCMKAIHGQNKLLVAMVLTIMSLLGAAAITIIATGVVRAVGGE